MSTSFKQQERLVYHKPEGQSLPPEIWANNSVKEAITRLRPTAPRSIKELSVDVKKLTVELDAAVAKYEAEKDSDPHTDVKRSLKLYLAEHEVRVRDARAELNRFEAAPPPAVEYKNRIADLEFQTSVLAREAQLTLIHDIAVDQYDQVPQSLSRETLKEIKISPNYPPAHRYNWTSFPSVLANPSRASRGRSS